MYYTARLVRVNNKEVGCIMWRPQDFFFGGGEPNNLPYKLTFRPLKTILLVSIKNNSSKCFKFLLLILVFCTFPFHLKFLFSFPKSQGEGTDAWFPSLATVLLSMLNQHAKLWLENLQTEQHFEDYIM